MRKFFIIYFLTIVNWQLCIAQFTDDFSDNDFKTNPIWTRDTAKFTVSAGRLRLLAPAVPSMAYLSTQSLAINNASWEFYVQMDFNPSSVNQSLVYLVSDNANLSSPLKGYVVKLGNTADEISLYRQDNETMVKIIDGVDGRLNSNTVKVKVKVTRDDAGNWQLFSDSGIGIYTQEGATRDVTYQTSKYFGIRCEYSATRADKFYFDNFIVTGNPYVDLTPPELQQIRVMSVNELELRFSKTLNNSDARNVLDYKADHELLNPSKAELYPDGITVKITFNKNFPNGITCQLSITKIRDISGNTILPTYKEFKFFEASAVSWRDVIVTEIFANPNPVIGLPEAEFIEIFNRSNNPVDLNKWTLTDGKSVANFSSLILLPTEYLIITSSLSVNKFSSYPKVFSTKDFPTLNNSGDLLLLKDAFGFTIDSLNYTDKWYQDNDKKIGGWSLEKIDPNNICAEGDNWIASEDGRGGTPGSQNSVYANKPDLTSPFLISVIPTSSKSVNVTFNEKLEKDCLKKSTFLFDPPLEVTERSFENEALTTMNIKLKEELKTQIAYNVTVGDVYDCAGNGIQTDLNHTSFGLPEHADSLDILINEILFNPTSTGVDFVEIYNNSSKFINLKDLFVSNIVDGILINVNAMIASDFLLKPFSYLALTENTNALKSEYPQVQLENLFELKVLPNLNDDMGSIAVSHEKGKIIDFFLYRRDMHSPFIKNDEGVSLERISFEQSTNDWQNWKSASSMSGYATPGYSNSNSRPDSTIPNEAIVVDPEIFIPAYGSPDFTQIKYKFDKGGYIANVKICDVEGKEVKKLMNNQTLGTEGFIQWSGDHNDGHKVRVGYYFVWFEVFDMSGATKTFRKRVVVATRF